ncbi:hypothetical protein JOQ06_003488 [Pogonophryne albipinna]|nr:hypothetical protein JOQ06_003488 [Pogonophryne albipinna]
MGNEASLEGGEGPLSGLPEGLAPDGKGGFVRVPEGTPVNLSDLSEEQRRQLAAAIPSESNTQRSQQVGASRGPTGLSKSRTVDAFNQGPPGKAAPGRSPSSLSLFENRFRQEPKDPESKSSGMFGSSFLSGANPLSAMTSSVSSSMSSIGDTVNMPKFGLFGDEAEGDAAAVPESKQGGRPPGKGPQQGPGQKGPQQGGPQKQGQGPPGQGPKPGQGPPGQGPKQGQGPPGQGPPGQAPRQVQGPPGQGPPGQQAPKPGQGPPGQGAKQGAPPQQGPGKQGPPGPGAQPGEPAKSGGSPGQQGAGKSGGGPCPLCKTTQLNVGSKDPPNYNNCTECKNQVCSLCGFSPPDSAGKEWLCLNCQMQRAMGGMDPPGMTKPKQGSAPPSPQRQGPGKPGKLLIRQQSTSEQGLTPPTTPRQKSPTSPGPLSPGSSLGGSPKIDPKTGRPIQTKPSPQQSPAKAKQESSFFGGFGGISLGGLTDTKPAGASQATESVTGKLFGGFGGLMDSPKPQAQTAPKQEESVAGKLFGGFGGLTESAKPPAAASQMFSFGSSLLSSATNIVSGEEEKKPAVSPPGSPPDSGPGSPMDSEPGSPPDSPFSAPGSPPDSDSAPDTPPAKSKKPLRTLSTELNVGSADAPNYSFCTECKKTVCNLCGFNPTPHLGEKEWLCLNCQTQRAMSGQLGDVPPPNMASPKKQTPAPSSTPAPAAVDRKPVVEAADLTPPAPDTKVLPENIPTPDLEAPLSVSSPPPDKTQQEAPQSKEQPLAAEPVSELVVQPEQQGPVSESAAESVPAVQQQQISSDNAAEDPPNSETNVDQQAQSSPVSEIPAGEIQSSSENATENFSPPVESEVQNGVTNTSLDETAVPAEVETEPKLEIAPSEAAAPLTDILPEVTPNSVVAKPALIPEAVSQEGPVQVDPKPDSSATNVEEEKITNVELDKPSEEPPIDETTSTPPDTVESASNVEQTDITNPEADSIAPDVKNEDIQIEAEPIEDKQLLIESAPPPVVEVEENVAPADKVEVPKPDETLQELPPKCVETDSPSLMSENIHPVLASEENNEANKVETKPIEKEEEPSALVPADKSPSVAPVEGETKEETKEEIVVVDKVNIEEEETAKQKIPDEESTVPIETVNDNADEKSIEEKAVEKEVVEEIAVEVTVNENTDKAVEDDRVPENAAAEKAIEVKDDEGKTFVNEAVEQETVDKANDQKPLEKVDEAESSPAPSSTETTNVCYVIKKREREIAREPAPTTAEHIQTAIDTVLKAGDTSEKVVDASVPPTPDDRKEIEHVDVKESLQSVEMVSSSAVIGETEVRDVAGEEKLVQDEAEAGSQNTNSIAENQHEVKKETLTLTGSDNEPLEKVAEQKVSIKEVEEKPDKIEDESQAVAGNIQESEKVSETSAVCDKDSNAESNVGKNAESKKDEASETDLENGGVSASEATAPVAEPAIPMSLVSEHDNEPKEGNTNVEEKEEAVTQSLGKPSDEDAVAEVKTLETLKEPAGKDMVAMDSSPTSPSDLAKLESSVLPILEAKANTQPNDDEEKLTDTLKSRRKLEVLPLSLDSPSSEDDRELSDKNAKGTTKKKLLVPMDVRADSLDESSESYGKESPMSGDDEDFIRKQIIEMSENEDASPSDEENLIQRKIRDHEKKQMEKKTMEAVERSSSGKNRRLTKKSTISPDDEEDKQLHGSFDKPDIDKEVGQEQKESQSGTGVRQFQTMELNSTSSPIRIPNDGEPEMESLTDSPDDRSRGEGSSSLHASSFTPGTSPTSISSLDEDSDSSPSHIRSGEGKQHRKAKHRQPGQVLPTIEDSSEEEELREEEELLREQEKQKGSGKKSKKDKEEIRAQRRRERPKTPPSNLSPIEDASPTEELRQEAEMEEIRRSSCSDFSPSIESDSEGFEIHPSKIAAVQKTYQLPLSVSLHSPSDDKSKNKSLKSADEAYEEIMLRAKSPTLEQGEIQPGKESIYGGMLIEDYAYDSLIDNSTTDLREPEKIVVPSQPKPLRSPDEVYEDMIKKRQEFMKLEQEYEKIQPKKENTNPEIVLQPAENTFSKSSEVTLGVDGKPLLDAETAYEELMKKVLTPGTSPTQQDPEVEATAYRKALHPIPDLRVTQCSSGELSSDDESMIQKEKGTTAVSGTTSAMETDPVTVSEWPQSSTSDQQPQTTIAESQDDVVDLSSALPKTSATVIASISPLPTVPQYTPSIPSVVSTAPPLPPKPSVLCRANSQEKAEVPVPPPLPPPTPPKPTVFPRKAPVPLPPQASATPMRPEIGAVTAAQGPPTRQAVTPMYKPHVPPPVAPKPSIHSPGHSVKPPIAPKPGSQPSSPAHAPHPSRPSVLPTGPTEMTAINLSPSSESKQFHPSPKSPSSPRYTRNLPLAQHPLHTKLSPKVITKHSLNIIQIHRSINNQPLLKQTGKNSYNFSGTTEGAVDLTSAKISDAGEAVDYSKKGAYAGMTIPPYSQTRVTSAVGTLFGTSSVLRSSNGVVYSSVAAPIPSTYAITNQPGSIFSTSYNSLSGMHTSDTMPSLSNLQNLPLTRSHSFLSTISITATEEQGDAPLNLEISRRGSIAGVTTLPASLSLDTYTDASLEAIAASLEALSSPMVPGDGQYQAERERLEMEKLKQQRLAEELEWERLEIQRFREHEQVLVQKELEELQSMKQHILNQQEDERQAHLMMQKETYAQQQQQLEQIQRLQEQLRMQLEEQKLRQMYPGGDMPGHGVQEAVVLGPDGTVLSRKITDSGCQTDDEDEIVSKAYTAGRKKRSAKKSVDSCVQTDDEDQDEWEAETRNRQSRPRTARGDRGGQSDMSFKAHTEISIQTDSEGNIIMDTRMELSDSERTSPKKRPTPLEIGQSSNLKVDSSTLAPSKSANVLYSPISPCISPSKSLEFVSYEKKLGDTSPQNLKRSPDPASPRGQKGMQRSMSDPPVSPTGEERGTSGDSYTGKSSGSTPTGTQKKVKRTLPNPPSEDESTTTGQTAYTTGSARRRMCRNSNMARAKILQDIDRELNLVERESSKLRKRQAELDEEEKEIDAKLRYLEMGINRRKDVLLMEREKRERAYLQSVAEDRDYMSDSEVSNIRETRGGLGSEDVEIESHGLERPRTAPQAELDEFVPPQTKHEYGKYSQYQYNQTQYQQSLYQTPQSYQSHSLYSSVPSLTSAQQQSYHQMLLLQQKAARQAALLSELDAAKYEVISRQPDPTSSAFLGVKYDKYGNHLDLRALDVGNMARSPMSAVSDSYYTDVDHHTPRSYMLLEDAAELAKGSTGMSSSYSLAERELAKAEKLLHRSAADLGSTDYLGSTSRLHTYGKTPDEEDTMEEPYELKLLKQQLKQEFRRSTGGTENLEQLTGLSQHYYTPSSSVSSYSQRNYPKTDKYSISRLTLEKQAAKQLPASMLYQKHKTPLIEPKISSKYSSIPDNRGLETDYNYLGSTSASARASRLSQDEITFGLRKNIAEQQKYLGSTLGANLAGSLNLGQSLGLDSAYPSGSRSRPSSRPTSCYGLDLSLKRDPSSSSLRLKGDGESSGDIPSYQTPSGRTKPTSLPIVQSGRGRLPIVAQNSEEESPLSPVGQPMGMSRASAGPLPPISADSRDQFGSCLSLEDSQQQQLIREEPTRGRGYVLMDDLQGTMSDSEALSDSLMALNRDDATNAYHLRREETDWFDKPRDGRSENGQEKRQGKGPYYPFPHLRVKLQRDPKDRSVSGNGLGIRVVGGKEVPASNGDIGAYVAKVLPGGAAEQTGKILEGMQVLEWTGVPLTGKTYEEVQGLVGQPCNEAELCVRLDLNMLSDSDGSDHLDFQEHSKGDRPPRSPGVDPKQLAAELQKVSQQQTAEGMKTQSQPVSGEIQLQIHYDKQLGNLIVHVLQARNLAARDNNGYSDPFVKVYLLPGRGQVMVVQNASAENKRRSKHAGKSLNPEWNQTVIYKNIHLEQLRKKTLEVSVWDYDKCSSNDFLGEILIDLSNTVQLDNVPQWHPLKEQSEGDHHRRSHSGQSRHSSSKPSSQHSSPKTTVSEHDNQDSPKSSVIKSRSHGIFPDPAKDTQVPTLEKSHSSPGTSKPSSSEGQSQRHGHGEHSRSHGASHSGKSATRHHHQDSGTGSGQRGRLSLRQQRHSVAGVLTIQTAQSDWLPALPAVVSANGSRADGRHLTLGKAVSEERPQSIGARSSYRSGDAPVTAASLDSGLSGSAYSLLDEEGETNEVDSAIFQVPRFGKIPNGTDVMKSSLGLGDTEGKSQVMGEIKIALKKEVKTDGEQLVLEILQCRNITYKFKSPDHLPDLYVKLYVVNIATQKRIIKKKTRVCRHDREPSFNETFRFCMNPAGHSLQLFLVSNGGKFMKKTLIGEAYVWLDKADLRKRVVSWHKLLASTAQIHS